jgi:hypothetical protein
MLSHVVNAGLRIMRINFSHAVGWALLVVLSSRWHS